jgi:hypothetical protein
VGKRGHGHRRCHSSGRNRCTKETDREHSAVQQVGVLLLAPDDADDAVDPDEADRSPSR